MRKIILIAIFALLTSCAGFKDVPYFQPVAQPDILVHRTWGGLDELVIYPLSNSVNLEFIVFDHIEHSSLRVLFKLPNGESMRFLSPDFVATSLANGKRYIGKPGAIQANYKVDGRGSFRYFDSWDELQGASDKVRKIFGGTVLIPRSFEMDVQFAEVLPDKFTIQMPNIILTGKSVRLQEVEFRRSIGSKYLGAPP